MTPDYSAKLGLQMGTLEVDLEYVDHRRVLGQ